MMVQSFQHYTMELGAFENTIIQGDWCVIPYIAKIKNLDTGEEVLQNTIELVNFKRNPNPIGVRVVEDWALSDTPLSATARDNPGQRRLLRTPPPVHLEVL